MYVGFGVEVGVVVVEGVLWRCGCVVDLVVVEVLVGGVE